MRQLAQFLVICCDDDQSLPTKLKHVSKQIWFGKFPANLTIATLKQLLHSVSWLTVGALESRVLSKDELALVVVGELPTATQLKHEQITIPCIDERGRNVLVAAVMVQCGEKKVTLKQGDGHNIAAHTTVLAAVTWWKHEWPESWQEICNNPYKSLKAFPGVHCLLKEDGFAPFLKLSGFNFLWLTPKMKDGKPHNGWKMIWFDSSFDLRSATVQATKLPESGGLVKQNGRFALRVPKAAFDDAWKVVFPNVEPRQMSHLDERLKGISTDLSNSFAQGLQQQTTNFQTNMNELKALMQQKPKRKANNNGDDADMSGS
eukprot:s4001_g1.t1